MRTLKEDNTLSNLWRDLLHGVQFSGVGNVGSQPRNFWVDGPFSVYYDNKRIQLVTAHKEAGIIIELGDVRSIVKDAEPHKNVIFLVTLKSGLRIDLLIKS